MFDTKSEIHLWAAFMINWKTTFRLPKHIHNASQGRQHDTNRSSAHSLTLLARTSLTALTNFYHSLSVFHL